MFHLGLALTGALTGDVAYARNSLVIAIPTLTDAERAALHDAGVKDTRRLYQVTHKGGARRDALAGRLGGDDARAAWLASVADLCRLYKVTPRTAHLLTLAGVGSTKELAARRAPELHAELARLNGGRPGAPVTENPPSERETAGFIKDAAVLGPEDWEQTRKWASTR